MGRQAEITRRIKMVRDELKKAKDPDRIADLRAQLKNLNILRIKHGG